MRLVADDLEIVINETIDVPLGRIDRDLWEGAGQAAKLFPEGVDMVGVNVGVSDGVDKVPRLETAHVSNHVGKESIGRDIERYSQAHIGAALVHLARQLSLLSVDVELAEHVAGRECHLVKIGWIPCRHDDAPVLGSVLDLFDALSELIDPLPGIVGVHVDVLRTEVAPLESVDGTEIANLSVAQAPLVKELPRAIAVPDVDLLVSQVVRIGVAGNEPQELLGYAPPEGALGGKERERAVAEGESHLSSEL